MNDAQFFQLPELSVIDVTGADAATIVHNLTTHQVRTLEEGQGHECFVTDVRGKTLGHVLLYRVGNSIRLIGAAGQSERVAQHIDRYTIREDATYAIRDGEFVGFALTPTVAGALAANLVEGDLLGCVVVSIADTSASLYGCRWLGEGSGLLLVEVQDRERIGEELSHQFKTSAGDEASFHAARTEARFPWFGIDLDESNLPQEADRDALTISFTKGCYLGQETVARLDALGQVQKKLVAWSIDGGVPEPGTKLQAGDKTVGRLTSVAPREGGGAIAIGPARRSHFEPGSTATGTTGSGVDVIATVL